MKGNLKLLLKKIMLVVMLVAIFGSNTTVYASSIYVGQCLPNPAAGWVRYDDSNPNIEYSSEFYIFSNSVLINSSRHEVGYKRGRIRFSFYGTSIALIDFVYSNRIKNCIINIDDGEIIESCSAYSTSCSSNKSAFYVRENLKNEVHNVVIDLLDAGGYFCLDAIDLNAGGYLLPYRQINATINLESSLVNLYKGQSRQLIKNVTPSNAVVRWESDNTNVAVVDQNGKVTGISKGSCNITAKVKNSSAKSSCKVNVLEENAVLDIDLDNDNVNLGEVFTAGVVIQNVQDIKAEDVTLSYDSNKLEIVGLEKVDGIRISKYNERPEEVRVICIEKNAPTVRTLLFKLKFKAKSSGMTEINISKGDVSTLKGKVIYLTNDKCGGREIYINN